MLAHATEIASLASIMVISLQAELQRASSEAQRVARAAADEDAVAAQHVGQLRSALDSLVAALEAFEAQSNEAGGLHGGGDQPGALC